MCNFCLCHWWHAIHLTINHDISGVTDDKCLITSTRQVILSTRLFSDSFMMSVKRWREHFYSLCSLSWAYPHAYIPNFLITNYPVLFIGHFPWTYVYSQFKLFFSSTQSQYLSTLLAALSLGSHHSFLACIYVLNWPPSGVQVLPSSFNCSYHRATDSVQVLLIFMIWPYLTFILGLCGIFCPLDC